MWADGSMDQNHGKVLFSVFMKTMWRNVAEFNNNYYATIYM